MLDIFTTIQDGSFTKCILLIEYAVIHIVFLIMFLNKCFKMLKQDFNS